MSNWFAFQHIQRQAGHQRQRKGMFLTFTIAAIIIFAGGWLINLLLKFGGFDGMQQTTLTKTYFSPSVLHWQDEIHEWAESWGVNPVLVATVMQIESCGDPQAVSPAGAQGLFQVMPYHFQPGEDMLDPQTNARRGLAYLTEGLQKADGNIELALAGYNGGHGQIERDPADWPAETRRYVHWGYSIYLEALQTQANGYALADWMRAGGWHLCDQAEMALNLR